MKRVSAVVDDEIVSFFQRHREYNLSEIVRSCLREFVYSREEVKVKVLGIEGDPPENAVRLRDEFYMMRDEWERLSKDDKGKYKEVKNPKTGKVARFYLGIEGGEQDGDKDDYPDDAYPYHILEEGKEIKFTTHYHTDTRKYIDARLALRKRYGRYEVYVYWYSLREEYVLYSSYTLSDAVEFAKREMDRLGYKWGDTSYDPYHLDPLEF